MLDQFIGQTLADKYRIDSVMRDGGGGLGRVYRATHLLMDKPVTVKILSPALAVDESIVRRFSQEARTVSHIAHPNILNVTDFGSDKNAATYIVFEGVDSTTLRDAIIHEGALPFERAANIARQIASALSAAHANSTIHRGLTSENILLTHTADRTELVKVLDFGAITKDENDLANDDSSTKNLEYLSPEQNSSVAEADERSDIYSLGVIFYEMLTSEVPYAADNATDLLLKQANNPPPPLSAFRDDLPAFVEPIILRALAKNPDLRYQSAAEFVADLNGVSDASGETVIVPQTALEANSNIRNNMWKTAFVVLAGISLLAISLIYATSSKQTDPATALQTDANGQPVQPLNPATGINETGASVLTPYSPEMMANSNMMTTMPQPVPNSDGFGDGYNPWARGVPPPGAPMYQQIPPGGQMIDPNNPNSIFMQDGTVLVPVPVNTNTSVNANTKSAATSNTNVKPAPANTTAPATPAPAANSQPPAPAKTPTPAPKPATTPAKTPPADRSAQSGKEQDS
ncbi:MAG: serine/threonine protein kinase [Acidobacteriota bacterium]|nr:serine/threonine protein kinase [Acidobacteriota bacterium]